MHNGTIRLILTFNLILKIQDITRSTSSIGGRPIPVGPSNLKKNLFSLRAFREKLAKLINEHIIDVMLWLNNSNVHPFDVLKTLQVKVRTSYERRRSKDTTFGSCMG